MSDIPLPLCKTFDCARTAEYCHHHAGTGNMPWYQEEARTAAEKLKVLEAENDRLLKLAKRWQEIAFGTEAARKVWDERNRLRKLIVQFVDGDPCRYDHNENCQTHNLAARPCPCEEANEMLKETP